MSTDLAWIVPAALGAFGLLSVAVWRVGTRWRFRRRLRRQMRRLGSFDRAERVGGALAVVELGLTRRSARALLEHVAGEEDKRVRVAIARGVAEREGLSRRRRVRRLRAWAADELARQESAVMAVPARPATNDKKQKDRKKRKKPPRISWQAPAPQS